MGRIGLNTKALKNFQNMTSGFQETVKAMRRELQDAAMAPLPSEKVKKWVDDTYLKAEQTARDKVAAGNPLQDLLLSEVDVEKNPAVAEESERNQLLEQLRQQHEKNLLKQEVQADFKRLQFQKANSKDKIKTVISEGLQLTQGAAHTSRKLFKLNKALALADAAVTMPSAVMKAIERGGGLPWGGVFGAITAATFVARINAIKNSKFGGSAPSISGIGGGATPTVNVSAPSIPEPVNTASANPEEARGTINLIFQGDVVGLEDFEQRVVDAVSEASDNRRLIIRDSGGRFNLESV